MTVESTVSSLPGVRHLGAFRFRDFHPGEDSFREALLAGLSAPQKAIPCRFLYDANGSALFDRICETPEYYPTRAEISILADNADDIAAAIGPNAQIIELGSGSSQKIGLLLDSLEQPYAYVPIDISREHLRAAARTLAERYPELRVEAICADYGQGFDLPAHRGGRRVCFYPGSTIGNLDPDEARGFLARWSRRLGRGALMLIGVDLKKSPAIVEAAYDDAAGVTAAFSQNLLVRANRELGADFDVPSFRHRARYDPDSGCVRIELVSARAQSVRVCGQRFAFTEGEAIHVENSWKYGLDDFRALAGSASFRPREVWTDERRLFSVHLLQVA